MDREDSFPSKDKDRSKIPLFFFGILFFALVVYVLSARFDLLERFIELSKAHEDWEIDEIFIVCIYFSIALSVLLYLQVRKIGKARQTLIDKNNELADALTEIKQLRGILPICTSCKKIRDDAGYWHQIDAYLTEHTDVLFSHGLCPDCRRKFFPDMADACED